MNDIFFIVDDNDVLSINHGDGKEGNWAKPCTLPFIISLSSHYLFSYVSPTAVDLLL
jgi:hypothetical protein